MAFFSEAKGGGGLPSPSISSKRRRASSSGSSRRASAVLKIAVVLVLVSVSFLIGQRSSGSSKNLRTSSTSSSPGSPPAPPSFPRSGQSILGRSSGLPLVPGKSGSKEEFAINVVTLSLKPRVFFLPGFADAKLASALADATEPKLSPSTLALRPGEKAEDKIGIRTSDGVFVSAAQDPTGFLAAVEKKAEALTGIPKENGEAFNILRYRPAGRYETHYDYFDNKEYGPQASQRVATLIVYLKTPSPGGGGETCFPLAEAEGEELSRGVTDYRACSGLKVPPTRPGDAVLFYNLHPNGTADRRSMHGKGYFLSSFLSFLLSRFLSFFHSNISNKQKKNRRLRGACRIQVGSDKMDQEREGLNRRGRGSK